MNAHIGIKNIVKNLGIGMSIILINNYGILDAKFYVPKTEQSFYRELERHKLAVVHFNPYLENEVPADLQDDLQAMKEAFFALSKDPRYKQSDLAFIGVNTVSLPEIAQDFKLDPKQPATVVLFRNGNEFKNDPSLSRKEGLLTRKQLRDFIEQNFGNYIDTILDKLAQEAREREQARPVQVERRVIRRTYYDYDDYYPDYGYYRRPYWGGGYWGGRGWGGRGWGRRGWGGGGFGIGIGFGW